MYIKNTKELREWIKIGISFVVLIVMIIGLYQIKDININLENMTSKEISTDRIIIRYANSTEAAIIYAENGTLKIVGETSGFIIG